MAYVTNDSRVDYGNCAGECPANAISKGDGEYVIDAGVCIDYGTCVATYPTRTIEG